MIKKRVLAIACAVLFSMIFLAGNILAANETQGTFDKSYICLTDLVNAKGATNMNTEELSLSLLALAYNGTMQAILKDELDKNKDSDRDCWPKNACTLKDTAMAMLAYDHINQDTKGIQSWLRNQSMAPAEITWYLQIDNLNNNLTQCSITYDNSSRKVTVNENKVISGSPGSCFGFSPDGFWLEVNPSCYEKDFTISCKTDFLTSTFYKKKSSTTSPIFITASTNVASPDGETTERIQSICLKQGASCNYEGSLWASLALDKTDTDFRNRILPYLLTLAPDNKRYIPSGFLYALTDFSEYLSDLSSQQDKLGYWQIAESSRRYYDTAIGILSLQNGASESTQSLSAKAYLLQPSVQQVKGCWNDNIRDVSLILYAASPRTAASSGITSPRDECESSSHPDYKCMPRLECEEELNATVLNPDDYHCFMGSCCNHKPAALEYCSVLGGRTCTGGINQDCEGGRMEIAGDTSYCCIDGNCVDKPEPVADNCPSPNSCKSTCDTTAGEDIASSDYSCIEGRVCCAAPAAPVKRSYWWVLLLAILIILLILAVIYRNQLKVWYFRVTSKFRKGPAPAQSRPPMPPRPGMPPGPMQRRMMPPVFQRGMPPRPFPKERELSETLNKLKSMSK